MRPAYILILMAVITIACNNNTQKEQYLTLEELYDNATSLTGEILPVRYIARSTPRYYYTSSGLWGENEINNKLIHLADTVTGEIFASSVNKGRGPKELLGIQHLDYYPQTEKFYVTDYLKNIIAEYKYENDTIVNTNEYSYLRKKFSVALGFKVITDSTFVFLLKNKSGQDLFIIDKNNNVMDSVDYHIFNDERIDHSNVRTLITTLTTSPDRETLFLYDPWYNILQKYSVKDNTISLLKEKMFLKPYLYFKNGVPLPKLQHTMAHGEVFATDKYVWVVSNPESKEQENIRFNIASKEGRATEELMNDTYILIFDYDFNFIKSYICDGHFNWITLMPDGKTFYAGDYQDELYLKKYVLADLN